MLRSRGAAGGERQERWGCGIYMRARNGVASGWGVSWCGAEELAGAAGGGGDLKQPRAGAETVDGRGQIGRAHV